MRSCFAGAPPSPFGLGLPSRKPQVVGATPTDVDVAGAVVDELIVEGTVEAVVVVVTEGTLVGAVVGVVVT
jgi:hypothetical protein